MVSIEKEFLKDHHEMDKMLAAFINSQLHKQNNTTKLFNEIRNAIKKHMQLEETLYETFKKKSSLLNKHIEEIRNQHEHIVEHLQFMIDAKPEDAEYPKLATELLKKIEYHEIYEEKEFYNKLDKLLTTEEKEDIIYTLQINAKETN